MSERGNENQRRRCCMCPQGGRRGSGCCIAAQIKSDRVLTSPRLFVGDPKAVPLHQPPARGGGTGPTGPLVGLGTTSQPPASHSPRSRPGEEKTLGRPTCSLRWGAPWLGTSPPSASSPPTRLASPQRCGRYAARWGVRSLPRCAGRGSTGARPGRHGFLPPPSPVHVCRGRAGRPVGATGPDDSP